MRVSEPVDDNTSSEAVNESSQEDSAAEGGRLGSEDYTRSSGSDSEASQVRASKGSDTLQFLQTLAGTRRRALKSRLSSFCSKDRKADCPQSPLHYTSCPAHSS